jgi:hypothetical protein
VPAKTTHKTKVAEQKDEEFEALYGGSFVASCACGWKGDQRSTEERAEYEAAFHLKEQAEQLEDEAEAATPASVPTPEPKASAPEPKAATKK